MKRYIRRNIQETAELNISDLVDCIEHIEVVSGDLTSIYSTTHVYDPDDDEDDIYYLGWDDASLQQLSTEQIRQFTNLELLSRISRVDNSKLSVDQRELLRSSMRVKYNMDAQQKENILKLLRDCIDIHVNINMNRFKNRNFLKGNKLTAEDVRCILRQLDVSDFDCKTRSVNADYSGDLVVIFKPKDIKLANGTMINGVKMYIKIDVTETKESIAIISFHD